MKIDLTFEEFKTLLQALAVADYILIGRKYNREAIYKKLKTKLLKIAKSNKLDDYYEEYKAGDLEFALHSKELDLVDQMMQDYERETYWESLIDDLAIRDLAGKVSASEFDSLDIVKRFELISQHREIYEKEFEKNGIINLRLLSSNLPF